MASKAKRILQIVSWVLFVASAGLIIIESATPSDASGVQSFSFSKILANLINIISPPKSTVTHKPVSFTLTPSVPSATLASGEKAKLFEDDEAIIGTTKMYSYTLAYPEGEADVYDSSIAFAMTSSPGEGSFTHTLTTGTKNGALRIIALKEGHYEGKMTDASGHEQAFAFDATSLCAPKEIDSNIEAMNLGIDEYAYFPFAMTFGDMKRSDTSVDHYLARYFDRSLTDFSSSDESIFKVEKGGVLRGISVGNANLMYEGEAICAIHVEGDYVAPSIDRIELHATHNEVAPLDFDYAPPSVSEAYGKQIEVAYFDALGNPIDCDEPVFFSCDEHLIAKVDNDHLEVNADGEYEFHKGGFVSGYRDIGTARIKAHLLSNPAIETTLEFESKEVPPTSVTIVANSGGKAIPLSGGSIVAGNSISFQGNFEPLNASDHRLHVEVSDESKLVVLNNDTNSPSINAVQDGTFSFRVYSTYLGVGSAANYTITVTPRPVIDDKDMSDFASFIRKAAGHFGLFLVTGIFGSLAFYTTLFPKKKERTLLNFGLLTVTGFAIAGISELIQAIPALRRGATWSDVGIDTLGFFFSALVIGVIFFIIEKKKRPRDESQDR